MTVTYAMFARLAGRLLYPARKRVLLQLTAHDWLDQTGIATSDVGQGEEGSPWDRQAYSLLTARDLVYRAAEVIERAEDPAVVNTEGLRHSLDELAGTISEAAGQCDRARRVPDIDSLAGLTPEELTEELAARDLAVYDASLRQRLPNPTTDAVLHLVYGPGGHVTAAAISSDGAGRLVGYAPTPTAALDLVATATFPRVPSMKLDPPALTARRPATYSGQDSFDVDLLREWFATLMDPSLPPMTEHLQACENLQRELAAANLTEYLAARADELNTQTPQLVDKLDFLYYGNHREQALGDHGSYALARTLAWVPTRLIVRTARTLRWNDFTDAHPETVPRLVRSLLTSRDLPRYTRRLFTDVPILLDHIPGPAGPLYTLTMDGTHRTHLARLLNLPAVLAEVAVRALPTTFDLLTSVAEDPAGRPAAAISDRHLRRRYELWKGLQRRGLIDAAPDSDHDRRWSTTELRCHRLPAFWWLCSPAVASRVNTEYERLYPGTLAAQGIPQEVGSDPDAWSSWLTS